MRTAAARLAGCLAAALATTALAQAAPVAAPPPAPAKTEPVGCESFMRDFPVDASGRRAAFDRPLTISRGFGDALSGIDVRILSSDSKLDGTLKCRGDTFIRFELRATLPADDKLLADFTVFARAALMAGFHWDRAKAETVEKALSSDAAEYLRASRERGDLYLAGKVEYHQGDRLDLGLIYTETDHTLVISSQVDD